MPDMPDAQLLEQFARDGSEDAFTELVDRHIGLVYSVAWRHTANADQAEDITQAVFVILARKANALNRKTVLPGWLYHTARLTAANWLRVEARRIRHEQEAFMQTQLEESPTDDLNLWRELSPQLDQAMASLGTTDRNAVVLRYFQNKSLAETGQSLGLTENAAQKRVRNALEKLRRFFSKHGVNSTAAGIANSISLHSVQVVPAALVKSTATVALAKGTTASVSTATLIKGALKVMAWSKAKTAIVAGVVILAAAGTSTIVIHKAVKTHPRTRVAEYMKQFEQTPNGKLAMGAVHFLESLKDKGQLPGIKTREPTGIEIPWVIFDRPGGTAHIVNTNFTFPLCLTLTAHANAPGPYHYSVTKMTPTNAWQLQKAWHADGKGNVLQEYSVQSE